MEDTPDFLRNIEQLNNGQPLPANCCLVTADITGAYQNIPQKDGINCLKEALEESENKDNPSEIVSPQFKRVVFTLSQTLTELQLWLFFIAHSSKL